MHIKLGVHLIFSPRSHRSQSLRLQMLRPDLVTRSPVPFNVAVTCICAVDGPVLTPKIRVAMQAWVCSGCQYLPSVSFLGGVVGLDTTWGPRSREKRHDSDPRTRTATPVPVPRPTAERPGSSGRSVLRRQGREPLAVQRLATCGPAALLLLPAPHSAPASAATSRPPHASAFGHAYPYACDILRRACRQLYNGMAHTLSLPPWWPQCCVKPTYLTWVGTSTGAYRKAFMMGGAETIIRAVVHCPESMFRVG
jgi:hypothetical protein